MPDVMIVKGSFSSKIPGLQTVWDSTSLGALKDCPQKYDYFVRHDWRSKNPSVHLDFGIAAHEARERYYVLQAQGADHQEAQLGAIKFIVEKMGHYDQDEAGELIYKPWVTTHDRKDLYHLVMFLVWYTEHYKDDTLKTFIQANGKPAVELSFKLPTGIIAPDGEEYCLSGHIDRVVQWEEELWATDLKSTTTTLGADYFRQYTPDNQISLYDFSGQMIFGEPLAGIIVDAVQILANGCNFGRAMIRRTQKAREEWYRDFILWLRTNEMYLQLGHYPRNDKNCHHYGGCTFRDVCASTPFMREQKLLTYFKKEPWDPTINRGQ